MNSRTHGIFLAIGVLGLAACAGTPPALDVSGPPSSSPADLEAQFRTPPPPVSALDRFHRVAGPIAIDALLTDSIEVGAATWTPGLEQEFLRRRGYSMRPYLPALAFKVLTGPWTVSFAQQKGAPPSFEMEVLYPLNESADAAVRYFSGIATYRSEFSLDDVPKGRLSIDLGTVADVARVKVNGVDVETTWFAPDRLDVSDALVPGINRIEIEVANLWVNRLIGDRQPGADPVTQTATMTYNADAPLRPSGLIGPLQLLVSPAPRSGE